MNNINIGSSRHSLSLSNQTSNSSNNSISEKDENPKNSKKQKLDQEIQSLIISEIKSKKTLFEISKEKLIIFKINYRFKNLVGFNTNGFDSICIDGPPQNIIWISNKESKPQFLAKLTSSTEETSIIDAKFDLERSIVWIVNSVANLIFRVDFDKRIVINSFGKEFVSGLKDGMYPLFKKPSGLTILTNGNALLCDSGNKCIRKIDVSTKEVMTLETTGSDNKPFAFRGPSFLVANKDNTFAYVSDITRIVSVELNTGKCTILAGSDNEGAFDAIGDEARFQQLSGISIDNQDILYVIDKGNNAIRSVIISTRKVQTVNITKPEIETAIETAFKLNNPLSIQIDPLNNDLCILDSEYGFIRCNSNHKGRLAFKRFALAVAIRAIGYTRGVLKQKDDNKALHKLIMRTFVSCLSPSQFEKAYNLGINLINTPERRQIIKDLILSNGYAEIKK